MDLTFPPELSHVEHIVPGERQKLDPDAVASAVRRIDGQGTAWAQGSDLAVGVADIHLVRGLRIHGWREENVHLRNLVAQEQGGRRGLAARRAGSEIDGDDLDRIGWWLRTRVPSFLEPENQGRHEDRRRRGKAESKGMTPDRRARRGVRLCRGGAPGRRGAGDGG